MDPRDGAILGGEGGDGGKEGGKKGWRATECSRYTCASKQEFSRFLCPPEGLPGPPQAWYLLIILERNSWVDVNWNLSSAPNRETVVLFLCSFLEFVVGFVLRIAKQLCYSCACFCALVCAFSCAGVWSLWLGLCSRLATQLC